MAYERVKPTYIDLSIEEFCAVSYHIFKFPMCIFLVYLNNVQTVDCMLHIDSGDSNSDELIRLKESKVFSQVDHYAAICALIFSYVT